MRFPGSLILPYIRWRPACLLLALALSAGQALAAEAARVDLTATAEYLEDAQGTLTLADVEARAASRFQPMADVNLGYSRSTFWFRIPLAEEHGDVANRLLEVAFSDLDYVAFYAPGRSPVVAGRDYPINPDMWPHRFYVFPLKLSAEPRYFYLQVRSRSGVTVPLVLWEPAAFADETQKIYLAQALYYGELLALLIYNLLIFLSLRERGFLLYSVFACFMGLGMLAGNGLARQFLWPAELPWPGGLTLTAYALTMVFALYFAQHFLQTRALCCPDSIAR
ncbi:MAG: 7TM-DISM domain-containing protein [Methylobacter sp.]|nr:7TM-DISM domain-containing protein [Methylobacter sp.]